MWNRIWNRIKKYFTVDIFNDGEPKVLNNRNIEVETFNGQKVGKLHTTDYKSNGMFGSYQYDVTEMEYYES